MQSSRLFEIIYILLNKDRVTARELAERFEVSARTIYRDIDTISLAGIPVYTEKGKGGGISLLPDFVLNKSLLSEEEQSEILSALQGLSQIQSPDSAPVLQKLSTIFNKTATKWLEVDFSDWSFEQEDFWGGFKTAILERRVACFQYYSSYSEKTNRRVEPIQLWFKSRFWYLKAYDLDKQALRIFKLTRIKNLEITEERFALRDLLATANTESLKTEDTQRNILRDAQEHIPSSEATQKSDAVKNRKDVPLRLLIKSEMAYRVLDEFAAVVEEETEDGDYIVSFTWPEDNWVYGTILSFGEYVEVLEPGHIRKIIKEKAERIRSLYELK